MTLPAVLGIISYSLITGFYREPLYWFGILFTIPKIIIFLFLPSLLYTIIMEILGIKLVQRHSHRILVNALIYLASGVLMGGLTALVLGSFFWLFMIGILTGLLVTAIKLRLHLSQRSAGHRAPGQ